MQMFVTFKDGKVLRIESHILLRVLYTVLSDYLLQNSSYNFSDVVTFNVVYDEV